MKASGYELIFAVVNSGFEDSVMDVARELGAKGGTILNARGTAKEDAEEFFKLNVHPDKSVLLILISSSTKSGVLKAIYERFGIDSDAQGIVFSLPVSAVSDNLKKQITPVSDKQEQ